MRHTPCGWGPGIPAHGLANAGVLLVGLLTLAPGCAAIAPDIAAAIQSKRPRPVQSTVSADSDRALCALTIQVIIDSLWNDTIGPVYLDTCRDTLYTRLDSLLGRPSACPALTHSGRRDAPVDRTTKRFYYSYFTIVDTRPGEGLTVHFDVTWGVFGMESATRAGEFFVPLDKEGLSVTEDPVRVTARMVRARGAAGP